MKAVTLIAASDEYDNDPGLMIKSSRGYDGAMADRGEGLLIAHDIVEHQNGLEAIGPIWDELQALGGIWHARGRWGDMMQERNIHSCETNVASDITRMARDLAFADWRDQMGPDICTRAHLYDDNFQSILDIARQDIPGELDGEPLDIERYLTQALHHMRVGYRKANRRFGDRFTSNKQMRAIQESVARAARGIDYEGQEFRLLWGNGECRIFDIEIEDY
jgi:hypothetical protein